MSPKRGRKHGPPRSHRGAPKSRSTRTSLRRPPPGRGEPDLIRDVRQMLRQSHPWELLCFVSSLLAAVDRRDVDPFKRARGEVPTAPTLQELVDSLADVDMVETTALLTVLGEMVSDQLLAKRIRRELAGRDHGLPGWLRYLAPVGVDGALVMSHVLGDGDNVMLAVRTAAGDDLTVLVYIDHNLGTLVKDGFVVEGPLDVVVGRFREASDGDHDVTFRELDLADARVWITEAIEKGAITYPPFETETWPACRPLMEWVVRQLPEGGTGYMRPEWDEDDRAELTEQFFASPFGQGHNDEDRQLFESILWFACDYGPGDPLRWSPVAVEMLLADWLPRKVVADADFLSRVPDLLRSFIGFSHAERGIRKTLTDETLDAVDRWEPDYQKTIRSERPQGPAALLAALGVLDGDALSAAAFEDLDPYGSFARSMLATLRDTVGDEEALRSLDADPLPDEPLDWEVIPDDVHDRVGEVLELVDRCCEELLDVEYRTACRRLLADVVAGDPEILRRRGRADTAAAALVWIVGKANDVFHPSASRLAVKDLLAWFGITGSVSQRANTMLKAIGAGERTHYGTDIRLGTTRYLVSERRQDIIERRDRYEAMSQ